MAIKETIRNNMYTAMKNNDKEEKQIYSSILDAIQKAEKNERTEYTDDQVVLVIQKYIKQCKETLQFAEAAQNATMVDYTQKEISVLLGYLPEQMDEESLKNYVQNVLANIEPLKKNKGLVMKECSKLKGKADMKLLAKIVDEFLQ